MSLTVTGALALNSAAEMAVTGVGVSKPFWVSREPVTMISCVVDTSVFPDAAGDTTASAPTWLAPDNIHVAMAK
jgi:hypothetical protein